MNIIVDDERLKAFPLLLGITQGYPIITLILSLISGNIIFGEENPNASVFFFCFVLFSHLFLLVGG